jgi:hypothetical protein
VDTRNTGTNLINNLVMTKEQYYWNIYRPQMLRQAVAGFAKKHEDPPKEFFKLRINAEWQGRQAKRTKFVLNGEEHPYTDFNRDIEIEPGTAVQIRLSGDSSDHVFSVDGIEVGYPIDLDLPTFTMDGNKTIAVVFTPYYT